jgi:hypothetical protein
VLLVRDRVTRESVRCARSRACTCIPSARSRTIRRAAPDPPSRRRVRAGVRR